jgi:hypothetical protein
MLPVKPAAGWGRKVLTLTRPKNWLNKIVIVYFVRRRGSAPALRTPRPAPRAPRPALPNRWPGLPFHRTSPR